MRDGVPELARLIRASLRKKRQLLKIHSTYSMTVELSLKANMLSLSHLKSSALIGQLAYQKQSDWSTRSLTISQARLVELSHDRHDVILLLLLIGCDELIPQ